MCRWIAYKGLPVTLESVICAPRHSLIDQSQNVTDPIESLLLSANAIAGSYARALTIDREALSEHQNVNDVVLAFSDMRDMERALYEKGATDGLPIVPPTPELVWEMIAYNNLDPQQVIAQKVPPQNGVATVEKLRERRRRVAGSQAAGRDRRRRQRRQ